jgi:phosphomannomutase
VKNTAQAISDYLNKAAAGKKRPKVVVGYDTRFLSDKCASITAGVLAANKIKVLLSETFTPTPALSSYIKKLRLSGGVMISASHNPPQFNGIKYKTYPGCTISSSAAREIESYVGKNQVKYLNFKETEDEGRVEVVDILGNYKKEIKRYLDWNKLKKARMKIAVDSMHGAAGQIMSDILKDTAIKVEALRSDARVDFGRANPEPILQNLNLLSKTVRDGAFKLGIAFDGDGDRIGCIGPRGEFINSSQIASLLLNYFIRYKNKKGLIVKTISSSSLIDKLAEKYNLKLIETPIGFKYLSKEMLEKEVLIAVEESGGIAVRDYIYDRDAIMIGLLLLQMVAETKKGIDRLLKSLKKEFGSFYYHRVDLELHPDKGRTLESKLKDKPFKKILGRKVIKIKKVDGIKFFLEDASWLLIRASGTEPILRLYAESSRKSRTLELLKFALNFTKKD